ncbi:hypothetical protein [Mycobacterium sp. Marseille-P9652]|uniref:hypothetical protein n=1 Tax=Mycobacterium sp. Marseille-P9652 TaxID=2654950 RepID=UPI0012E8CA1D|nr:hypothetical protein [Mycobacterium sp. Marseille-P9652]
MDADDPEQHIAELEHELAQRRRIADLERQIAEAKAAAGPPEAEDGGDAHARRYAEALWAGLASGRPAGPDGPSEPELAQHREAFMRAAAQAGLSQEQLDDIFKRGKATIKVNHSVVYSGPQATPWYGATTAARPGIRDGMQRGANLVGGILGFLGICVGGAAALIAAMPSSALWMSSIVCSSGYHLTYGTSDYSYKPGQSGTSVSFECVGGADSYSPAWFVIDLFQSLLVILVVGAAVIIGRIIWKRLRPSG